MRALELILSILVLTCAHLAAQPIQAKHAQVELLSLQADAVPGSELLVGVHFVLEKGWHIYWINPGDSGQPPSLQWQLPTGFTAGAIEWPRPERMQSSSQLVDYGYHDSVLLMVPIKVAQVINIDGRPVLEFAVEAKWLICREVCLPDHAHLSGKWSLASGQKASPKTAALFAATQKCVPEPWPRSWELFAISRKDTFVLGLGTLPSPPRRIPSGAPQFFPLEPGQVENAARQSVQYSPDKIDIILKKSDLLVKPISVLRGVLVFPDGEAFQIEVPVDSGKGIR